MALNLEELQKRFDELFDKNNEEDFLTFFINTSNNLTIEEIIFLIERRLVLLEKDDKNELVDRISNKILFEIKENYGNYPVDFILETCTKFGQAPNIIYDDNGLFAVSGDGYQPVVIDDERIEGTISIFVEKEQWFKTIRMEPEYIKLFILKVLEKV